MAPLLKFGLRVLDLVSSFGLTAYFRRLDYHLLLQMS